MKTDASSDDIVAKIVLGGTIADGKEAVVEIANNGAATKITGKGQTFEAKGAANAKASVGVESNSAVLHTGANSGQKMALNISEISSSTLGDTESGLIKDVDLTTQDGANKAIDIIDVATKQVSAQRSALGTV